MASKIILDCDPGVDDALAIAFAYGHPGIELLGLTTVAGNVGLESTTRNALAICEFIGAAVPVVAGCAVPLVRPALDAREVHGESGLGGAVLPAPARRPGEGHAVDFIISTVRTAPGEITLVATGPLTNIALAVLKEPRLVGWVRDFVIMGGSSGRGNTTPAAEYNMWADPEAAAAVFRAGWTVTMLGLDVTLRTGASAAVLERMADLGVLGSRLLRPALDQYTSIALTAPTASGTSTASAAPVASTAGAAPAASAAATPSAPFSADEGGPPVHDVCAVVQVAEPGVFGFVPAFVEVETSGGLTSGMTVTDFRSGSSSSAGSAGSSGSRIDGGNARVAMTIDTARFWDVTLTTYARLAEAMGEVTPSPGPRAD